MVVKQQEEMVEKMLEEKVNTREDLEKEKQKLAERENRTTAGSKRRNCCYLSP
ncbi:MAG: hypothetical protein NY202_04270 [Mollicutes bacterium UO1]